LTDSGSQVRRAPDKAGISNLIDILAAVARITPDAVEGEFDGRPDTGRSSRRSPTP